MSTITLPHSEEGERIILSCILLDGPKSLAMAIDGKIEEEVFYVPCHRRLWRAIQWQHKNSQPLELYALAEELKKLNKLHEVGGMSGLVEMTQVACTTAQLPHWIDVVRQHFVMRELHATCSRMAEKTLAHSGSIDGFVMEVNNLLTKHHEGHKQETLSDAAESSIALIERVRAGTYTDRDVGMTFPWLDWDRRFGLAKPGELIIISARPGMGKSSCCRQIAQHWARDGKVLLFSREMPTKQIAPLFAQMECGISYRDILSGRLSSDYLDNFKAELAKVKGLQVAVYDSDRTLSHIVTRAKAFAQIAKPKAICVDYLQRYDAQQERGETRDMALGRFTMAMKDLAIELSLPVVLLAQLGRSVERENREPRLSDLRESGNLEQDADRVIFLNAPDHRPDGTMQTITDNDLRFIYLDAIQAKGRLDGTGRCGMMFDRPITKLLPYQPA